MDFSAADGLVQSIVQMLPQSPFSDFLAALEADPPPGLGWLNWFVPIGDLLRVLAVYVAAIAGYYALSVILRWVKLIGD